MLLVIAALGYLLCCVYLKFLCRAACGRGVGTGEINDTQYQTFPDRLKIWVTKPLYEQGNKT